MRYPLLLIALLLSNVAVAEPPQPPSAPVAAPAGSRLLVVPRGKLSISRPVRGKVKLVAAVSGTLKPDAVVFYADDAEIGRVNQKPYSAEWDTSSVLDGEHKVRWSARWSAVDAQGNELAAGVATLIVKNQSEASAPGGSMSAQVVPVLPEFVRYSSSRYGFGIEHPKGWTAKVQRLAGSAGGYWLIFSTEPIALAAYVVNLRHKLLQREHTPESFTRFTPYVADWNRRGLSGRTIFSTTAGTVEAKRVVHRAMILNGRHLYMMNCIDTSGASPEYSKTIFTKMVDTLSPVR